MRHITIRTAAPFILASAILSSTSPASAGGGAGGTGNPISGGPTSSGAGGTGYLGEAGQNGDTNCVNTNGGSGGGGGGGAGGGAGGSSGGEGTGCVVTSGGAGGTAVSPDGQDAPTGGGGGGGGYNGNGAGTATLNNSGNLEGGTGGMGGTLPTAPQPHERSGAGGGGAGGYGAVITGSGSSSNTGTVFAGGGGRGGFGRQAGAGDGGQGGIGVLITGDGVIFSNTTNNAVSAYIRGGGGGFGGNSGAGNPFQSGNAGDGGAGIVFAGVGGTLINSRLSTIQGGAGGTGGTGNVPGANGLGGVGVEGADLTIINAGQIVGGNDFSGARANAITFTGGVNRLELQAGSSVTGNVLAFSASDTLTLGGDTDASFDLSQIAVQYQGFGNFEKSGDSVWTLTGTTTEITPWSLKDGILSVSSNSQLGDVTGGLTFDGGTLRVTGTAFNSLGGRALTWGADGGGFDIVDAANSFTLTEQLSGSGGLVKTGAGALVLDNANNTYAGDTVIEAGILSAAGSGAIGDQSAVTISAGAALNIDSDETIGSLAGAGEVSLSTSGAMLTTGGNNATTLFSGEITYGGVPGVALIVKTGSGTMTLTGDTTDFVGMTVSAGKLVVGLGGAGSLAGTIDVKSGATLGGTGEVGQVTIEAGGTHAPGNSIGTQFVNGPYLLSAGSTLEIEANAAGASDKVVVIGSVDLSGAVLRVLAENGSYSPSTSYVIVDNDGADGVTGTFGQVISNLAFLAPTVSYAAGDGNDVVLTLTRNQVQFGSLATTPNQLAVANALSTLSATNPLVEAVTGQSVGGARQAFDAMSGEVHATVGGLLVDQSRFARDTILGRLLQAYHVGDTGVSAIASGGPATVATLGDTTRMGLGMGEGGHTAPPPSSSLAFWTQGYGSWGDFETNGDAASADRTIGGFVSGMDAGLGGGWRAGLATGYMQTGIGVGARASSASVDSYSLGGYAGGRLGDFALRGGGVWTWHQIDTDRSIAFPGFFERVEASYNGNTGQVFGEIALPVVAGKSALEPFAGIAYVSVDTGGFTETGGIAALTGSGGDESVGYSTLGLRAATEILIGGVIVTPHVSAAWQHALDDVTADASLAFASFDAGFTVSGVPIARDAALIEAGVMLKVAEDASFGLSYQGQVAGDVEDHGLSGRFDWRF